MSEPESRKGDPSSTKTPEAIIDDLKSVIARSISGNLEVAGRVRSLVQALVQAPASPPRVTLNPRANVSKLLDFNVTSLRVLTEHVLGAINEIVDEAEASLLGGRRSPPSATPDGSVAPSPPTESAGHATEITMAGSVGERASAPFLVENHYDRDVDVTFDQVAPPPEATPAIPPAALQVEPARVSLAAHGQAIVYAAVAVDKSFVPGTSYHGAIRMLGFESRPIRVRLDVTAAKPAQAVPAAGGAKPKVARKPAAKSKVARKPAAKRRRTGVGKR